MRVVRIGIVGDYNTQSPTHRATNEAIQHVADPLSLSVETHWVASDALSRTEQLETSDALWIAPGSPYKNMDAVLMAIRYAREKNVPLIGTCGGFQHVVIEYARHVLGFVDAQHAEYDPDASTLFVTPLPCSLVGQKLSIHLLPTSRASAFYGGTTQIEEEYYCNFGLNPEYQSTLEAGGLRIVGVDDKNEARVLELPDHRFFIATLYVPQTRSSPSSPHPLIVSFVRAAVTMH